MTIAIATVTVLDNYWYKLIFHWSSDATVENCHGVNCAKCNAQWSAMLFFPDHNQQNGWVEEERWKKNQQCMGSQQRWRFILGIWEVERKVVIGVVHEQCSEAQYRSWKVYWTCKNIKGYAIYGARSCMTKRFCNSVRGQLWKNYIFSHWTVGLFTQYIASYCAYMQSANCVWGLFSLEKL